VSGCVSVCQVINSWSSKISSSSTTRSRRSGGEGAYVVLRPSAFTPSMASRVRIHSTRKISWTSGLVRARSHGASLRTAKGDNVRILPLASGLPGCTRCLVIVVLTLTIEEDSTRFADGAFRCATSGCAKAITATQSPKVGSFGNALKSPPGSRHKMFRGRTAPVSVW